MFKSILHIKQFIPWVLHGIQYSKTKVTVVHQLQGHSGMQGYERRTKFGYADVW